MGSSRLCYSLDASSSSGPRRTKAQPVQIHVSRDSAFGSTTSSIEATIGGAFSSIMTSGSYLGGLKQRSRLSSPLVQRLDATFSRPRYVQETQLGGDRFQAQRQANNKCSLSSSTGASLGNSGSIAAAARVVDTSSSQEVESGGCEEPPSSMRSSSVAGAETTRRYPVSVLSDEAEDFLLPSDCSGSLPDRLSISEMRAGINRQTDETPPAAVPPHEHMEAQGASREYPDQSLHSDRNPLISPVAIALENSEQEESRHSDDSASDGSYHLPSRNVVKQDVIEGDDFEWISCSSSTASDGESGFLWTL